MPGLAKGVRSTTGTSSHVGFSPSTLQETMRPVLSFLSSNESNLDNKRDNKHLNVGDLVRDSMKSVIDDSLRRLNPNKINQKRNV